jgi:hypothetical protein
MPRVSGVPDARAAIWALADELERRHGLTRMYGRASPSIGVLSISMGVTVWCDGQQLSWRVLGEQVTWPASDPNGAAARLAPLARRPSRIPAPRQL